MNLGFRVLWQQGQLGDSGRSSSRGCLKVWVKGLGFYSLNPDSEQLGDSGHGCLMEILGRTVHQQQQGMPKPKVWV